MKFKQLKFLIIKLNRILPNKYSAWVSFGYFPAILLAKYPALVLAKITNIQLMNAIDSLGNILIINLGFISLILSILNEFKIKKGGEEALELLPEIFILTMGFLITLTGMWLFPVFQNPFWMGTLILQTIILIRSIFLLLIFNFFRS